MDSLLSLVGSIVIGTLLLLSALTYQLDVKRHSFMHTNDLIVQYNASGIIDVLEEDFKNIGSGVTGSAFSVADSNNMAYYLDLDANGITDSVRYFLGGTNTAAGTPNPRDRILYRIENNEPQVDAALGTTDFKLKYYDENGNETTVLTDIKTIEVTLELESTLPYDEEFSTFYWRKKITPQSLVL